MNLQQLEYFKVIAETNNFTTASKVLSITQPALSKAIAKLEEELDVHLFERQGRQIKMTKFGEVFLKYAESAISEIEKGKETIQHMKKSDQRELSIAATYCIGATWLPYLLSNFLKDHLDLTFNIHSATTQDILKHLRQGKIDVGFFSQLDELDNDSDIYYDLVHEEEFVLIVPKLHPLANKTEITLDEIKDEKFIVYQDKSSNIQISYSDLLGYTPTIVAQPTDASVLAGLVAAGAGIAIIIETPLLNTNKISFLKIKDNLASHKIYMGWSKSALQSPSKNKFKEYVINRRKNDLLNHIE